MILSFLLSPALESIDDETGVWDTAPPWPVRRKVRGTIKGYTMRRCQCSEREREREILHIYLWNHFWFCCKKNCKRMHVSLNLLFYRCNFGTNVFTVRKKTRKKPSPKKTTCTIFIVSTSLEEFCCGFFCPRTFLRLPRFFRCFLLWPRSSQGQSSPKVAAR